MANARPDSAKHPGFKRLDLNKALAGILSEEGMLIAVLAMALPTQLSTRWGLGLSLVGLIFLVWEYGYQEKLPNIVGPYRIVRNPHSLALWLLGFGSAIAARSFPGVILSLVLLPWLFYIDHEENGLSPNTKLLRYRYRVPALIPTLIPFEASPNQGFSWRRAVKVQRWPAKPRLLSTVCIWAYLIVSLNFNLPSWGGIGLAIGLVLIKLLSQKTKLLGFAFRKKSELSSNPIQ